MNESFSSPVSRADPFPLLFYWRLAGECPASPALKGLPLKAGPCLPAGRKGHNIRRNTFPGSAELHFHDI